MTIGSGSAKAVTICLLLLCQADVERELRRDIARTGASAAATDITLTDGLPAGMARRGRGSEMKRYSDGVAPSTVRMVTVLFLAGFFLARDWCT